MNTQINKFQIIDNFLDREDFHRVSDIISSADFPWYFQDEVANFNESYLRDYYFTHCFFTVNTNQPSIMFNVIKTLIEKLSINKLLRAKANLYPNVGALIENSPHVDFPFSHQGAIFYINTNNGKTILHDGTRIDSISNRLLLFDASLSHQSTYCTDKKVRLNINLNYH